MDKIQITQLKDEGIKEELRAPEIQTMENRDVVMGTTMESRTHSIPDFLNRFHVLDRFNWTTTDARGTVLKEYRFPDQLTAIASIRNKFLNFYGLRAGVQLIIQVNSQPFQAGNLLISFLPNARYNDVKRNIHEGDLKGMVSRTGTPRVNLDLMDGTRVDMTVPYASPFVFYNLFTKDGTIGDFHISVYSQLRDVASTGFVTVTVAARFVDVELAFPTGTTLPTSDVIPGVEEAFEKLRLTTSRGNLAALKEKATLLLNRIDEGTFQFQMNTAASAFKQKAVPHMATVDDSNLTHMLSTHTNSSLAPLKMGDTSTDDMSFKEILSIPCYHNHFTIVNTDVSNTNKYSVSVTPLQVTDIVNTDSSISADYIYTIANLFRKWRGSIKYKFRVIKTKYHSLRVRISFAPGATTQAGIDRDSCYSEIFDLRENNTCEFTVPYIHPYPWLNTKASAGVAAQTDVSLGLLMFDVHNQMVNPSTVSNTIDVIVERCAGPDFEVAVPTSATRFPFDPTPGQTEESDKQDEPISNSVLPDSEPLNSVWTPRTYSDVPLTPQFLANMHNLPSNILEYLNGAMVRDPSHFHQNLIAVINEYAGVFDSVPTDLFSKKPSEIITMIQSSKTPHHVELRSIDDKDVEIVVPFKFQAKDYVGPQMRPRSSSPRFESGATTGMMVAGYVLGNIPWYYYFPSIVVSEVLVQSFLRLGSYIFDKLPFKKDLTTEGIEPNPGPIYTTRSLITGTQTITFTSPYAGIQRIKIRVGVVPQLNVIDSFDCAISSNADPQQVTILPRAYTGLPFDTDWFWNGTDIPAITFTGQSTGTHENFILCQFITENTFQFQMKNFEQDIERNGNAESCITQPTIVSDMAKFCMGNQITSVKQMISRSTLLDTVLPADSRPIHIMTHGFGVSQNTAMGTNLIAGYDNLSYFASMYAFARGGVNFRIQASGAPYRVIVNTNNDVNNTTSTQEYAIVEQQGDALTINELVRSSNLMQHIIVPNVEGVGEFSIPFYSSSYCQSIDTERAYTPSQDVVNFILPDTHCVILPQGQLSEVYVFRNANPDYQFSYLTGPPLLYIY